MPELGLLDPHSVRAIAAELDLRPSKARGQNFVIDPNTVRRIVGLSEIGSEDVVLEIGPGLGSLTLGLLEVARAVIVVEIDQRLADRLAVTVAQRMGAEAVAKLHIVTADAMEITSLPGPPPTALVANLPYNVSVPVLLHLLEAFPSWQRGLVMVQLEVADRLAAMPGSKIYGVPSAKLAWWSSARRVGTVPPKVFWPVPNVDSGLVRMERRDPPTTSVPREQVFRVIDAAFVTRRKMLRSALAGLFGGSAAAASAIAAAGVDPQARGEVLDIASLAAIAAQLPAEVVNDG